MAGYYHGAAGSSEIQGEGLQTLYLMNPSYVSYTHDNQVGTAPPQPAASPANMVFLSSVGNPIGQANLGHLHQQNPAYVGIPLQQDVNRLHYNLWTPADPSASASPDSVAPLGLRRPASQQQGLSLSLSPHQPAYSAYRTGGEIPAPASAISPCGTGGDEARITRSTSSNSGVSNGGVAGLQGVLVGSKYLKATQELLDEVVNVGGRFVKDEKMKGTGEAPAKDGGDPVPPLDNCGGEVGAGKRSGELSTAERQELQTKKAKLVNMLDEVEQRYRQYHHQMQIVVAAFEAATGPGSARTYTALALQTISRQFRCLRDAIAGQIRAARRSLGEDVGGSGIAGGSSRLRAVEQQLRQQRALQQLGMGQGANAWRPQRGLPERSVSVLRAWLFEHFLHPYPKDSDKLILAKQTGLTRSQVSNWFINARVRLWKPMVEEMYLEEMKDQELNGGSEGKAGKSTVDANEETSTKSTAVPASTSLPADDNKNNNMVPMNKLNDQAAMGQPSCFPLLGQPPDSPAVNFDGEDEEEEELEMAQGSSKKLKNDLHDHFANTMPLMGSGLMELKPNISSGGVGDDDQFCRERRPTGYSLMGNAAGGIQGGGGFGVYQNYMDQFAPRFPGNGVSLTLGLPHCESGPSLAMAGAHQSFLSVQGIQIGGEENDFCDINVAASSTTTHSATAFENINIQNRKGFATQLLPDFVV